MSSLCHVLAIGIPNPGKKPSLGVRSGPQVSQSLGNTGANTEVITASLGQGSMWILSLPHVHGHVAIMFPQGAKCSHKGAGLGACRAPTRTVLPDLERGSCLTQRGRGGRELSSVGTSQERKSPEATLVTTKGLQLSVCR